MNAQVPRVLIRKDRTPLEPISVAAPATAWKALGWFGLLLAVIGLADVVMHWFPPAFHSPEWEFATVAMSLGSLPLLTMGLAAMLGSVLARGSRPGILAVSIVLLLLAVAVAAAYGLFLMDVPLALRASKSPAGLTIRKAIVRTSVMGIGFGAGYLIAAIASLRYLFRRVGDA